MSTTSAPNPPTATSTSKSISSFLATIQTLIHNDSTTTMGDLAQLEEVNGKVRDRYKVLADGAGRLLGVEGGRVGGVYADIEGYAKQIDSMEEKVGNLEQLVEELERLADELDGRVG